MIKFKKGVGLVCILVVILFVSSIIVKAEGGVEGTDTQAEWPQDNSKAGEIVANSVEKGGSLPEKNLPDEVTANIKGTSAKIGPGNTKVENGEITTAKGSNDDGSGTNIEGWKIDGPADYTIKHADYWKTPTQIIVDGNNIVGKGDKLCVGKGATIDKSGKMLSTAEGYCSEGNVIKVDSAKVVVIDNTVFNDVGDSTFVVDSQNHLTSVNITSAKDDNSVELKDATIIIDTGESFDALIKPDGSLVVNTNDPAVIKKDAETIITLTNEIPAARKILNETNITEKQVGKSSVDIDSVLGVVAVHMAPTTRYISYVNNTMSQPFAVYAQPLHSYDFYLKKTKDQIVPDINSCLHCGVMDFEKDTVVFHGYFDYERVGTNGKYVKIVQGKAENDVITLFLDRNMNKITDVSATGSRVHMYSGPFEVMSKAA